MRTTSTLSLVTAASFAVMILGCADQGYSVIASTGTIIGVNLGQQPANGSVDATLGYKRAEFAFVPTNRGAATVAAGARDSANVVMELRYSGMFSTSENAGIYQRLAVGDLAVQAPGAAVLFAKAPDGSVDSSAASAIAAIPAVNPTVEASKRQLTSAYLAAKADKGVTSKYDKAAQDCKYKDFPDFAGAIGATGDDVKCVRAKLVDAGVTLPN